MRFTFLLSTLVLLFAVAVQATSCEKLALSGPGKYKAEVQQLMQEISDEIQSSGKISDTSLTKLDKKLASWKDDMGGEESYHCLEELRGMVVESQSSDNPFKVNQNIQLVIDRTNFALDAEVRTN